MIFLTDKDSQPFYNVLRLKQDERIGTIMKKRNLAILMSALFAISLTATGCKGKTEEPAAVTEASRTASAEKTEESTKAAQESEAKAQTTDAQKLAKELLTRHVKPDDVITEDVIQALITELKSSYQFEKLDNLKIASGEWVYVANGKGWFEDLFGDNNTKVTTVEGTIGNEAQLMERGELHISSRMLYPYLLYKSQGANISAVQLSEDPSPKIVTILVDAKSDINSIEDLKGKTIGSWNAGCQYVALLEQTENLGWKEQKDWTYKNVSQDGLKTALLAGELDAISVHPLTGFNSGIIDGSLREIGNALEGGTYQNYGGATVFFSPTKFAGENVNILKAVLKLHEAVADYILDNEEDAAKVVEGITRTPVENTIFWWERSKETFYASNDTLENITSETDKYQDWLVEHGIIDKTQKINADDFYLEPYFE